MTRLESEEQEEGLGFFLFVRIIKKSRPVRGIRIIRNDVCLLF